MENRNQSYVFHVTGMHCDACVLMIESDLQDVPGVSAASSSLATRTATVTGDFGDRTPADLAAEFTRVLAPHGYVLSLEKSAPQRAWGDFRLALPIAFAFVAAFAALQKAGLVNLITASDVTYGTAFFIGIVASLSTCMVVVGGLVLSMSATFAKEGDKVKPQLMFHTGRLVSFFVLGGAIGALGSAFRLNQTASSALSFAVGLVMLVLGINLLDIFESTKRWQPSMPKAMAGRITGLHKLNHRLTPLLAGVATFFLPCGFTQSMQLYTLSTGSYVRGALTMTAFALGTLPVLALISFSSFSVERSARKGVFFKSAGLIVILFALYNMLNALVAAGILPPLFNF